MGVSTKKISPGLSLYCRVFYQERTSTHLPPLASTGTVSYFPVPSALPVPGKTPVAFRKVQNRSPFRCLSDHERHGEHSDVSYECGDRLAYDRKPGARPVQWPDWNALTGRESVERPAVPQSENESEAHRTDSPEIGPWEDFHWPQPGSVSPEGSYLENGYGLAIAEGPGSAGCGSSPLILRYCLASTEGASNCQCTVFYLN